MLIVPDPVIGEPVIVKAEPVSVNPTLVTVPLVKVPKDKSPKITWEEVPAPAILKVPEVVTGEPVIVNAVPVSVNPTDVTVPDPPPLPDVSIVATVPEIERSPFVTRIVFIGRPSVVPSIVLTVNGGLIGDDIYSPLVSYPYF